MCTRMGFSSSTMLSAPIMRLNSPSTSFSRASVSAGEQLIRRVEFWAATYQCGPPSQCKGAGNAAAGREAR
jgi:hypothetical protein